jgi:hypothetical protein
LHDEEVELDGKVVIMTDTSRDRGVAMACDVFRRVAEDRFVPEYPAHGALGISAIAERIVPGGRVAVGVPRPSRDQLDRLDGDRDEDEYEDTNEVRSAWCADHGERHRKFPVRSLTNITPLVATGA